MIEQWNKDVQRESRIYGLEDPEGRPHSGDFSDKAAKRVSFGKENFEEDAQNKVTRRGPSNANGVRRSRSFHDSEDMQQRRFQDGGHPRQSQDDSHHGVSRGRGFSRGRPRDGENRPKSFHEGNFNRQPQDGFREGSSSPHKPREGGYSRQWSNKDRKFNNNQFSNEDGGPKGKFNRQFSGSSSSQDGSHNFPNNPQFSGKRDGGSNNHHHTNRQFSASSGEQDGGHGNQYHRNQQRNNDSRQHADTEFEPRHKRRQGAQSPSRREQYENAQVSLLCFTFCAKKTFLF